jgi:hypothetical protein
MHTLASDVFLSGLTDRPTFSFGYSERWFTASPGLRLRRVFVQRLLNFQRVAAPLFSSVRKLEAVHTPGI